MLSIVACAGALALTLPAAAQAKSCGTVKIQFRSDQPKLELAVSAKGMGCGSAREKAARTAVTHGLERAEGFICSVQNGPTIGECWTASERKRFSWRPKA
jgi:hypothetical protein